MASQDTMEMANAEGLKADSLENEAQRVLENAQQQASGLQRQSQEHRSQQSRLMDKFQQEAQAEQESAKKEAQEAKERLGQDKSGGLV